MNRNRSGHCDNKQSDTRPENTKQKHKNQKKQKTTHNKIEEH